MKKQTLLLEGDVCTYNAFIEKRYFASYTTDEKEMNTSCSLFWRLVDRFVELLMGSIQPIEAIEDSELLLLL
jgi:hypothetical protein